MAPKPVTNSRILKSSRDYRLWEIDSWVDQAVTTSSNPTFGNVEITGDLSVRGDTYLYGNTLVVEADYTVVKDNVILLNKDETGSGVSLGQAGLEVDRGSAENYRMVFDETSRSFQVGFLSNLASVVGMESGATDLGIVQWNQQLGMMFSDHTVRTTYPNVFIGDIVPKSRVLLPSSGSLSFTSGGSIFGASNGSIVVSAGTVDFGSSKSKYGLGLLYGTTAGNIHASASSFAVPKLTITDSALGSIGSMYTSSGNVVLTCPQNIEINASQLRLDTNTLLNFDNICYASANVLGDLDFVSGSGNVTFRAGSVLLKNTTPIMFGGAGQQIYADIANQMFVFAANGITFSGANVNIPQNTMLSFDTDSAIRSSVGNLHVRPRNDIFIENSFLQPVAKFASGGTVSNANYTSLFGGNASTATLHLTSHAQRLVSFQTETDTNANYYIGRNNSGGGALSINFPQTYSGNPESTFKVNSGTTECIVAHGTGTVDFSTVSTGTLYTRVFQLPLDTTGATSFNAGGNKLENVADPTAQTDAANKRYVDLLKQGLYPKDAVNVATTASTGSFTFGSTIDNVNTTVGTRILVKDIVNYNSGTIGAGLYTFDTSGALTRTVDLNTNSHAAGAFTFVKDGTVNKGLGWICTTPPNADIVDVNDLSFTEFTGLGQVDAGAGLSKDFNTIGVNVDTSTGTSTGSIEVNPLDDTLRLSSKVCGVGITGGSGIPISTKNDQSHVNILGTIGTGVWEGTVVSARYGGTGVSNLPSGQFIVGNGTNGVLCTSDLVYSSSGGVIVSTGIGLRGTSGVFASFGTNGAMQLAQSSTPNTLSLCGTVFESTTNGSNLWASNVNCTLLSGGGVNTSNANAVYSCIGTLVLTDTTATTGGVVVKASPGAESLLIGTGLTVGSAGIISNSATHNDLLVLADTQLDGTLRYPFGGLRATNVTNGSGWWFIGQAESAVMSVNEYTIKMDSGLGFVDTSADANVFKVYSTGGNSFVFYHDTIGSVPLVLNTLYSDGVNSGLYFEGDGLAPNGTIFWIYE